MKNSLHLFLFAIVIISCSNIQGKPKWLDKLDHVTSPDGKVVLYQTVNEIDGKFHSSVATWVQSPMRSGGAGVIDIISLEPKTFELLWNNDSTVTIKFDSAAEVIRKESEVEFLGRVTRFTFEPKD